ncbi:heme A synthase [Brevibacillus sp. M2.1A]|uniref:COX15/CtaA family protein n=1 Tax=Brevibacillus sp. M2.1A TaxID=2738980 RepID=UPI00156B392C|nr:heme A synthase [Brevibacillus sp. M2.1A]MCC8438532.1 heme A synthase [Brevibacillus sp. M2.1A]
MKTRRWLRRFTFLSMYGMLLILIMGALVTKTESGRGCGDDWPLCNGKFVPAYTIESFIEYSHRFVSGVVGIILLTTLILVFRYSGRKDAKWFVSLAMFCTILQAILGAMAVIWPQSSAVLALHFGISLVTFALTLLLSMIYMRFGLKLSETRPYLSRRVKWAIWLITVYSYGVVYLGAFVRHSNSGGGCTDWPLCNGQVIPELSGATLIVFIHRFGAILMMLFVLWLFFTIRKKVGKRDNLYQAGKWMLIYALLQIVSGGFMTLMMGQDWYLLASMLHTILISCLFGILCYLCVLTLPGRKKATK